MEGTATRTLGGNGTDGRLLRSSERVVLHSLTWLVAGNAVGLWVATLLLFPELGTLAGSLTYGRWLPVHFDLHLYGWTSLPMVGVLLRLYLRRGGAGMGSRHFLSAVAVSVWSGCLLVGAASWLSGHSSGKLFLEWTGSARVLWAGALAVLAGVLWIGLAQQVAERRRSNTRRGWTLAGQLVLLVILSLVPAVLYLAASPDIYPPINPDSGGPTGVSLMGSALGMVAILYLYPYLAGLRSSDGGRRARRTGALLAAHFALYGFLDHGDASHHDLVQLASLASVAVWWPLLVRHLRRFPHGEAVRGWLWAFGGWGALLVATGVAAFLPGALELLKFTNALVAHAHVAMAGLVTCFDVLLLEGLSRGGPLAGFFRRRGPFVMWHGGTLLLVVSLTALGLVEASRPGLIFGDSSIVATLYGLRWLAGGAMLWASAAWLSAALTAVHRPRAADAAAERLMALEAAP